METMTWQSILSTALIGIVSVAITLLVSWLRGKVTKWTKAIDNPVVNALKGKLNEYLDDAINTTDKKFVDKLKEIGVWDKINGVFDKDTYQSNAEQALNLCYDTLLAILPKTFKETIGHYFSDSKMFLMSEIDRRMKEREIEEENHEIKNEEEQL